LIATNLLLFRCFLIKRQKLVGTNGFVLLYDVTYIPIPESIFRLYFVPPALNSLSKITRELG